MPGQYKTQEMCERAVESMPKALEYVLISIKRKKHSKLLKVCHGY